MVTGNKPVAGLVETYTFHVGPKWADPICQVAPDDQARTTAAVETLSALNEVRNM
jgi:hypothetical protein